MDILQAIELRHSVRSYREVPIEEAKIETLRAAVADCNRASGLHIGLITQEPRAFGGRMAHYGKFTGVNNYFAMIGDKTDPLLDEKIGYYGERLVLHAQRLGLNTCWVALTYKKVASALNMGKNEKLRCVIALGYGTTAGVARKSKSPEQVSHCDQATAPACFTRGVEAALLAPTAMNQQKFHFTLHNENLVDAETSWGFYARIDLGIAKYHFEQGAGRDNFEWLT